MATWLYVSATLIAYIVHLNCRLSQTIVGLKEEEDDHSLADTSEQQKGAIHDSRVIGPKIKQECVVCGIRGVFALIDP